MRAHKSCGVVAGSTVVVALLELAPQPVDLVHKLNVLLHGAAQVDIVQLTLLFVAPLCSLRRTLEVLTLPCDLIDNLLLCSERRLICGVEFRPLGAVVMEHLDHSLTQFRRRRRQL